MTFDSLLRRFFSRGARVLNPAEADQRAIAPAEGPRTFVADGGGDSTAPPPAPALHPDARELREEHRGY